MSRPGKKEENRGFYPYEHKTILSFVDIEIITSWHDVFEGQSGGPLYNNNGELIGVLSFTDPVTTAFARIRDDVTTNINNWIDEYQDDLPPLIPNDSHTNATTISSIPFTEHDDKTSATYDPNDPSASCAPGYIRNSFWYTYTPSGHDIAQISVTSEAVPNLTVAVFKSDVNENSQDIFCQTTTEGFIEMPATFYRDEQYTIMVGSRNTFESGWVDFAVTPAKFSHNVGNAQKIAPVNSVLAGASVAIDGDTLVVGAPDGVYDRGSAYVYTRRGNSWIEQQELLPYTNNGSQKFGSAVAISGDTIVVGAWSNDYGGFNSGSAFVFIKNGNQWELQEMLVASDGVAYDHFGQSVAIDDNTIVVGSVGENGGGAAYVYTYDENNRWVEQKITAKIRDPYDGFGNSVAIDNGTIVVGAWKDNEITYVTGAVYTFTQNGGQWEQQQKIKAEDATYQDYFGGSVAIKDNTLIVGSRLNDNGASINLKNSGAAYVFKWDGTKWSQQQKLSASDRTAHDVFGDAVAISEQGIVIGALGDDDVINYSGAAYTFTYDGNNWIQQAKYLPEDLAANDQFGNAVAIDGNMFIVGSHLDDDHRYQGGSAYVFTINDDAPRIIDTNPAPFEEDVPIDTRIDMFFSEDVFFDWTNVQLECSPSYTPREFIFGGGSNIWTLMPEESLPPGQTCSVGFPVADVTDLDTEDPPDELVDTAGFPEGTYFLIFVTGGLEKHDLNGDGNITPTDAIFVTNRIGQSPVVDTIADVDGDGDIDERDVNLVIESIGQVVPD